MTPMDDFIRLVTNVTSRVAGKPVDRQLASELNAVFPPGGPVFRSIEESCQAAIKAGWMCNREAGGIRYGRVVKPSAATHGFSVDVVDMNDVAGPHHRHPKGEIDLIMPVTPNAVFDGHGAGWLVYGPDTAHSPTVTKGRALVLYLLPDGTIEFTR
ncbi:MAG: DUF4863 family protein [Bradyrhizobium sp.]